MSTVMYAYRLPKDELWPVLLSVREFYAEKWPPLAILRDVCARVTRPEDAPKALRMAMELGNDKENLVDLQIFDDGRYHLIRPLETGRFFLNYHERWPQLSTVFVDTRSDDSEPETLKGRLETVKWIADEIDLGRYLIYQVVAERDFINTVQFPTKRLAG